MIAAALVGAEFAESSLLKASAETKALSLRVSVDALAAVAVDVDATDNARGRAESTSIAVGGGIGNPSARSLPLTEAALTAALAGGCSADVDAVSGIGSPIPSRSSSRPRENGLDR